MKVLLHYVGNATYNEKLFKLEAKKYGVNRAIPKNLALKLKPGDIVLLAFKVKDGAKVFGYMIVEGFTIPSSIAEKIGGKCQEVNAVEERGCGTIVIKKRCEVDDWSKVVELLKHYDTKVFVYGRFRSLEPFIIPAKFTLSGQWIDIEKDLPREAVLPIIRAYEETEYYRRPYTPETVKRRLLAIHTSTGGLSRWLGDAGKTS